MNTMTDREIHEFEQYEALIKDIVRNMPDGDGSFGAMALTQAVELAHAHAAKDAQAGIDAMKNLIYLGNALALLASTGSDDPLSAWIRSEHIN